MMHRQGYSKITPSPLHPSFFAVKSRDAAGYPPAPSGSGTLSLTWQVLPISATPHLGRYCLLQCIHSSDYWTDLGEI